MATDAKTHTESMDETRTWPDLAIGLYDRLTGRGAEITYEFENMEVDVPSKAGEDAEHAHWRVNGSLTIHTRDRK
ncbi:hypothetical protein ACFO0N_00415 [Halobium salinum]|uniref:Halobacterial output domain-containing protein n=1 Tax=Halobium salinum TaxID=1364940 RepID=A0ABD5P7E8_9EURY|nr:hypothetical protein [Halobium salinum]